MRLRLFAGMLGALALAACSTTQAPPPAAASPAPSAASPASVLDTVTVKGTQALVIAELAYNSAGHALLTATQVGLVRPGTPLAATLRGYNATASRALEVARTTRSAAEQAAQVAVALSAITSLQQATPAAPSGGDK